MIQHDNFSLATRRMPAGGSVPRRALILCAGVHGWYQLGAVSKDDRCYLEHAA